MTAMNRTLATLALVGLALLAPAALAQKDAPPEGDETVDNPAWVEDCPPDMMCAYAGGEGEPKDEPAPEPTCSEERPCQPAPDAETPSGPGTCMDGTESEEVCHRDVQYFGDPGDPAATGPVGEAEPVSAPADAEGGITSVEEHGAQPQNAVPALATVGAIVGLIAAALLVAGRRSR